MTCTKTREIAELDGALMSDEHRARLEAHAASCADCGAKLDVLRRARAILTERHPAPPSAAARARAWEVIAAAVDDDGRGAVAEGGVGAWAERLFGAPRFALGAAVAAIVVAAIVVLPKRSGDRAEDAQLEVAEARASDGRVITPGASVPSDAPIEAPKGARLRFGGAMVELGAPARFVVDRSQLELTAFRLEAGARVDVTANDGAGAFELQTPEARIRFVAARAHVARTDRGTSLEVERGRATVWPRGSAWPTTLGEGERLELAARAGQPFEGAAVGGERGERGAERAADGAPSSAREHEGLEPEAHAAVRAGDLREGDVRAGAGEATPAIPATKGAASDGRAKVASAEGAARSPQDARDRSERGASSPPRTNELDADDLAALAAAERRRGSLAHAAELYGRLARHPAGASYREQALLEQALLLAELKDTRAALDTLADAERLHPNGPTAPERTALAAELHLTEHDASAAAEVIERAGRLGRSPRLAVARVEVARALLASDARRARLLLEPVLAGEVPRAVRDDALDLAIRAARALGDESDLRELERPRALLP